MEDEIGLTAVVASAPNSMAHNVGAVRNSHAEIPDARATISSEDRVSRQKQIIPPSSTANGRICIATNGSRSPAISTTSPNVASGLLEDRRSSSMKSNSEIRHDSAHSIATTIAANWRTMYNESVIAAVMRSAVGDQPPARDQARARDRVAGSHDPIGLLSLAPL